MNQNMQMLEYSIINLKKQLHTVTDKYNELSVILEKKYTEMPSVLKSHADEMQQDFDQQLKKYNEQIHHDQLELLKKQNDDVLKNYILNALQEKLNSRLKSKNINHAEILNKIIVDYKKTAQ